MPSFECFFCFWSVSPSAGILCYFLIALIISGPKDHLLRYSVARYQQGDVYRCITRWRFTQRSYQLYEFTRLYTRSKSRTSLLLTVETIKVCGNTPSRDGLRSGRLVDVAPRYTSNFAMFLITTQWICALRRKIQIFTMALKCASVLFLCILHSVVSFNLEPRIPVIKFGDEGSYFGFSVAEHLTIENRTRSIVDKTSWWVFFNKYVELTELK